MRKKTIMSLAKVLPTLPFVVMTLGTPTQLWVPKSAGDYQADNETGKRYADALIAVMREHEAPNLLGQVVKAMVEPWSGVEVGFMHRIAERLTTSGE